MKKSKKLTITLTFSLLLTLLIHLINKLIFFFSTTKELLYYKNSDFYQWRFGKIFYAKSGSGTPLLLIHDLMSGSCSYEWDLLVKKLSQTHTVYCIDLLGCGLSEKPNITYTNYLYVQLISDFVKNVIKQKVSIIATGNSSSFIIMACYQDNQLFHDLIFINPTKISTLNQYPTKKHKLLKHCIETPILGTFLYNCAVSKLYTKYLFHHNYFNSPSLIRNKYIIAYQEASHRSGASAKYLYASIKGHFTNVNIIHALKEINNSIYLVGGENESDITSIISEYVSLNPAIESHIIPNSKHLPQLEQPLELLNSIDIYLSS